MSRRCSWYGFVWFLMVDYPVESVQKLLGDMTSVLVEEIKAEYTHVLFYVVVDL